VLVEGDEFNEPISDAARSILDGHVMLTRELAAENHYPAIDVLQSVSRLMDSIVSSEHRSAAATLREVLAVYNKARDLINIGAYQSGSSPEIDEAITLMPQITRFLRQDRSLSGMDDTVERLLAIKPQPGARSVAAA
jgi:flagellar biosynthesis/type III secretory pathway ATPase